MSDKQRSSRSIKLWLAVGVLLTGCPYDAEAGGLTSADGGYWLGDPSDGGVFLDPSAIDASLIPEDLPPQPSQQTLCSLEFMGGSTVEEFKIGSSLDEIKAIFGDDGQEAQSQDSATLQYRFAGDNELGLCGISLNLKWLDGRSREIPGGWEVRTGHPNYYLERGDVQGMPYPTCWPRAEPD